MLRRSVIVLGLTALLAAPAAAQLPLLDTGQSAPRLAV